LRKKISAEDYKKYHEAAMAIAINNKVSILLLLHGKKF
jgi:hypothetical protein